MLSGAIGRSIVIAGTCLAATFQAPAAEAGCGCDKPPPPPAAVRPSFASPGQTVTLFGASIGAGNHRVTFLGLDGTTASVTVQPVVRRDLADGVEKNQLEVSLPDGLPLGPTEIRVTRGAGLELLRIDASRFTVLQRPLRLEPTDGVTLAICYRAAVDAQGTVYFPFDVGAIRERTIFAGIAHGYPLLFGPDDVVIYNTQGFLMQLLAPEDEGSLYLIDDPGTPHSFELVYDRHEFVTYQREHVHEAGLALDRRDPRWHVDGTPHVDHDHLVLAISGRLEDGSLPVPGATPPFDLSVATTVPDGSGPGVTRRVAFGSDCAASAR